VKIYKIYSQKISVTNKKINSVNLEMDRKRVISHSYNVERVETLLVQHEREIELTAARLMIILLIELNTRTCGGLCKRPFMRIVYIRWINSSEYNSVARNERNEIDSLLLKITPRWFRVGKRATSSPTLFRKLIARGRVFFSFFFLRASFDLRYAKIYITKWSARRCNVIRPRRDFSSSRDDIA